MKAEWKLGGGVYPMRKIQKRILSLALPLFVILISGLTFAASPEAAIGKTKYETLEKALNAVKKGETIRLLKNIRCDEGKFYELRKNTSYSIDFSTFKIQKLGGNPAVDTGSLRIASASSSSSP
jgi:hypothetical protein